MLELKLFASFIVLLLNNCFRKRLLCRMPCGQSLLLRGVSNRPIVDLCADGFVYLAFLRNFVRYIKIHCL